MKARVMHPALKSAIGEGLLFSIMFVVINYFVVGLTKETVVTALISGLLFGASFRPLFNKWMALLGKRSRKILEGIEIKIGDNERLIKEGPASHFRKYEAVGGKLALTDRRLIFKSHRFNFQNHEQDISLDEIESLREDTSSGRIMNILLLDLSNGDSHKFIVDAGSTSDWMGEMERVKLR